MVCSLGVGCYLVRLAGVRRRRAAGPYPKDDGRPVMNDLSTRQPMGTVEQARASRRLGATLLVLTSRVEMSWSQGVCTRNGRWRPRGLRPVTGSVRGAEHGSRGAAVAGFRRGREPSGSYLISSGRSSADCVTSRGGLTVFGFGMIRWSRPVGVGDHDPPLADAPPPCHHPNQASGRPMAEPADGAGAPRPSRASCWWPRTAARGRGGVVPPSDSLSAATVETSPRSPHDPPRRPRWTTRSPDLRAGKGSAPVSRWSRSR